MEEFEKLESELTVLWDEYVVKHRILVAMEQAKYQVEQAEERRHQEQLVHARAYFYNYFCLIKNICKGCSKEIIRG